MKEFFKDAMTKFGVICLIIFAILQYNNDYTTFKDHKCILMDKISTVNYKGHSFYLILQDEDKNVFAEYANPATFSQAEVGKSYIFELRRMDIKQSVIENILFFFLLIFFGAGGVIFTITSFLINIFHLNK